MFTLAESLWSLLSNPTVAYLLLVLGMWALVLALSIPGTGLPEGTAIVALALAAVGLSQLPVNLSGLALIGLALVLFVLEFRLMAGGALLAAGGISLGVGSVLLFRVEGPAQAALSWFTVLGVTGVSTGVFGFFVSRGLVAQRLPPAQNPDRVVGTHGVAETEVAGQGSVYVGGESWSAHADGRISAGSAVVVLSRQGLRLKVAPAAPGETR